MLDFSRSSCIIFLLLLILLHCNQAFCHKKGLLRPSKSSWKHFPPNSTQTQLAEQQFMQWVRFVGRLRHSLFTTAFNKIFPSYTLSVHKNPSHGDFTSIQAAIDSLPFINLVRAVIKVHEGIYKWVLMPCFFFMISEFFLTFFINVVYVFCFILSNSHVGELIFLFWF